MFQTGQIHIINSCFFYFRKLLQEIKKIKSKTLFALLNNLKIEFTEKFSLVDQQPDIVSKFGSSTYIIDETITFNNTENIIKKQEILKV